MPWFTALGALAALTAGCSPASTDSTDAADSPEPEGPGAAAAPAASPPSKLAPALRGRLEQLRRGFPSALAEPAGHASFEVRDGRPSFSTRVASVALAASADGASSITDRRSGMTARFRLLGASAAPAAIDGDTALYRGAGPEGADVVLRATAAGAEDFVAFDRRPAKESLAYSVDVSGAAGLRLVANTLELLDAKGAPRLRVAPPSVVDATGARREAALSVEGCAFSADPVAPWGRPVTPAGADTCTVVVTWSAARVAYPALVDPAWETTTNFVKARTQAAAVAVDADDPSSVIFFSGGFDSGGVGLASTELYFPLERSFAAGPTLASGRAQHTATRLATGEILIAGGLPATGVDPVAAMEVYDPADGTLSAGATMSPARAQHTATLLDDGSVLFAGGTALLGQPTITAARYSPVLPGFVAAANMTTARAAHTATLLRNGKVLVTGGFVQSQNALLSVELFNPATSAFEAVTAIGAGNKTQMTKARAFHTATRIDCKTVLITGGTNKVTAGTVDGTAEIWRDDENVTADDECPTLSPATVRGFDSALVTMQDPRARHSATLLPDGTVVVAGGTDGALDLATTELFELSPPSFTAFIDLPAGAGRRDHTAVLVNAGFTDAAGRGVLVAGGSQGAASLADAFVLARDLGETCGADADCESGFCTDGVCCDTRCDALCVACVADQKEDASPANTGLCGPQKKIDPATVAQGSTLPGELPTACKAEVEVHTFCDGTGNVDSKDFPCEPATCGGNGFCTTFCNCNGPAECGPMGAAAAPCAQFGWCDTAASECIDKFANGAPCAQGFQCVSDLCVDGICCSSACDENPCEACDVPGKLGLCSPVGTIDPEQPHPNATGTFQRAECAGDGVCKGFCDGLVAIDKCTFPASEVEFQPPVCGCGDADPACDQGPTFLTKFLCDGAGSFTTDSEGGECGGTGQFKCAGDPGATDACLTTCASDDECLADAFCDDAGACQKLPDAGHCNADLTALRLPGAEDEPCAPYTCQPGADGAADACRTTCESKAHCIDKSCNTDGECVDEPAPPPEPPSCATSSPGAPSPAPLPLLALLALTATLAASRRRRPL